MDTSYTIAKRMLEELCLSQMNWNLLLRKWNTKFQSGGSYLNEVNILCPALINKLINKHDLCEIDYYENMGIAFVFSCQTKMVRKSIFDSDPKYNLEWTQFYQNNEYHKKLLHYEQITDYWAQPIKLENGWLVLDRTTILLRPKKGYNN